MAISMGTLDAELPDKADTLLDASQDLKNLAKEADLAKGRGGPRTWRIPFTVAITEPGTIPKSFNKNGGKAHFIFMYPGILRACQEEGHSLLIPSEDVLRQRVDC